MLRQLLLGIVVAFGSASPAAHASSSPNLNNMDFEQGEPGSAPPGWNGKAIAISLSDPEGGAKSLLLTSTSGPQTFGRTVDAAAYRGKRIQFRAAVRTTGASAGLWMRIDPVKGGYLFFDNMSDRPVRSSAWTFVDIIADVPVDASTITFGGLLFGPGKAGFDTASLAEQPQRPMTPEARIYLGKALDVLQAEHINRGQMGWPKLRAEADAKAQYAQTPSETYPAIDLVIRRLGERHTHLDRPRPAATRGAKDIGGDQTGPPMPTVEALTNHITALRLPYLVLDKTSDAGARYQTILTEAVTRGMNSGVCGWVVDLRNDNGGNMWPMVNGLSGLLDGPPYPRFLSPEGKVMTWKITRDDRPGSSVSHAFHIAVLIDASTASSGEMTAIAFLGQPNVRVFGMASAGLTTANRPVRLSDGAILTLTSTYVQDRKGTKVDGSLFPDTPVAPEAAEGAALTWLQTDNGCN